MLDLVANGRWREAEQVGSDCLAMSESTRGSELRRLPPDGAMWMSRARPPLR